MANDAAIKLELLIEANTKQTANAIAKMERTLGTSMNRSARSVSSLDKQMALLGATAKRTLGYFGLGSGVFAAGLLGRNFVTKTIAQQEAISQLEAVLRSTKNAAGLTADELTALATGLQRVTTYGNETVISAEGILLTFTKIGKDTFPQAIETVLDMSTALKTDLKSSALLVGKALQDPVTQITNLRQTGVNFTTAQQEVIKNLVKTGHLAEAQALILKELQVEFGGSARAAKDNLGGALKSLGNAWGDLFEVSRDGSDGLVKAINAVTDELQDPATIAAIHGFGEALFNAFAQTINFLKDNQGVLKFFSDPQFLKVMGGAVVGGRVAGLPGAVVGALAKPAWDTGTSIGQWIVDQQGGIGNQSAKGHFQGILGTNQGAKGYSQPKTTGDLLAALGWSTTMATVGARGGGEVTDADQAAQKKLDALKEKILGVTQSLAQQKIQIGATDEEMSVYNALHQAGIDNLDELDPKLAGLADQLMEQARATYEATQEFQRMQQVAQTTGDLLYDALDGLIFQGKSLDDVLKNVLVTLGEMALKAAIFGPGGTGQVGGIAGAIGSLFGGFRAGGGPVTAGKAYVVGEKRPELFVPRTSGAIAANTNVTGGGGRPVIINQTFDQRGADPAAATRMEAYGARWKEEAVKVAVATMRAGLANDPSFLRKGRA